MRRKDREVTDLKTILEIINKCEIIRIGLSDGQFPYIVPLNFAYAQKSGQIEFYIHGAMAGRKYELMNKERNCSFEMDVPLRVECIPEKKSITMRYECVMGTARIDFLEGEEKRRALAHIIERYEINRDFEYDKNMENQTAVARLTVLELTAKVNPV